MKKFAKVTAVLYLIVCMLGASGMEARASEEGQPSVIDEVMESVESGEMSGEPQEEGQPGEAVEASAQPAAAEADLGITAQSAVLMEASTGTVIYEKNPDEALRPASITKIMTLLLIFDALESGKNRAG